MRLKIQSSLVFLCLWAGVICAQVSAQSVLLRADIHGAVQDAKFLDATHTLGGEWIPLFYDLSTNWTTTNTVETKTLIGTNRYTAPGPYPTNYDPTYLIYYCHTETEMIYHIKSVQQQTGVVSSNVFAQLLTLDSQSNRVDIGTRVLPGTVQRVITNESDTQPTSTVYIGLP